MLTLVNDVPEQAESGRIERRRGLRIAQRRPVKIFEPASLRFLGGQTCDISTTGLRIELSNAASLMQGKVVNIHVGPGSTGLGLAYRRDMIPARVVWVDRGGGQLIAGIEFLAGIAAHLDAA